LLYATVMLGSGHTSVQTDPARAWRQKKGGMQVYSGGASTCLLWGNAWSTCGHGSACGYSQGALRDSTWKHMRPPAWRGVHAARGGSCIRCDHTVRRTGARSLWEDRGFMHRLLLICSWAHFPAIPWHWAPYVSCISYVCFIWMFHMLQWLYLYVASVCFKCFICFRRMLQSVLSGYCICLSGYTYRLQVSIQNVHLFQRHVANMFF
jgi:hypothetical protein